MASSRRYCVVATFLLASASIQASQFGILMPSHRFPTDISFHASYNLGLGSTNANYSALGTKTALTNAQSVNWNKSSVQIEYQPSTHFAFGGNFVFQRTSLNSSAASSLSKWTLGDQNVFAEYRFIDAPGYSLGVASVVKFPGYLNDTVADAQTQSYTLLPGDAQTDFSAMITGEFWPAKVIRLQSDFGYLFRSQSFANELIYQASVGFVIPRVDISVRFLGYSSIGKGPTPGSTFESEISTLHGLFGSSNFAYSTMPSLFMISPKAEFWVGPEYALTASFTKTMRGTNAPVGNYFEFGFVYRFSERRQNTRRNFTEVDIHNDQSSGVFEGELQEKNSGDTSSKQKPSQDEDSDQPLYYEPAN